MTMATSQRGLRSKLFRRLAPLLPAEWSSSLSIVAEMAESRAPREAEKLRNRAVSILLFACGAVPGGLIAPNVSDLSEGAVTAIFGGVVAFAGLLVGFLVTLMLFTGRLGSTAALTVEELRSYGSRLRYLLVSQAVTLAFAMAAAVLALAFLVVHFAVAPLIVRCAILALAGGTLLTCMVRSLLLPMQIYELHDAHLNDELDAKARESDAKYGRG